MTRYLLKTGWENAIQKVWLCTRMVQALIGGSPVTVPLSPSGLAALSQEDSKAEPLIASLGLQPMLPEQNPPLNSMSLSTLYEGQAWIQECS